MDAAYSRTFTVHHRRTFPRPGLIEFCSQYPGVRAWLSAVFGNRTETRKINNVC